MTDLDLPRNHALPVPPPCTPEQQRRAALTVARHCTDVDDCRQLLDMLGLRQELRRG